MTSKDRYLAVLKGQPVDFLPRLPILMQYAAEFIGSNYGEFASDHRVLADANIASARHFGIDQLNTMSDPYRETQGFGAEIIYERDMVPRCARHPLEDAFDLGGLPRPDPLVAERMLDRIRAIRLYKQLTGDEYSIMGWVEGPAAEAADIRRLDNFFMDLLDDGEKVGALMSLCVDVAIEFARHQVEAGADTIGIGDAVASQVSPDVYEDLVLPHEQRLVRELKKLGARVRLHICGNITHLLPGIASLGLDILDVDHMVDLQTVRSAVGGRVALAGNLDPVQAVLRSRPEKIREQILECYGIAGNPFMVGAGCEIPHGTPVENLEALCAPVAFRSS